MSGVKNLRAMFEQKGETSPPDRGRSPGIPWSPSESPRPLSKVRTNFIAIEKDGRIGLQRETSQDSSISAATRKFSGGSDTSTPPAIKQDSEVSGANMATATIAKIDLTTQSIPESPRTEVGASATAESSKNTGTAESKPQAPSTVADRLKKLGLDGATSDKPSTSNGPVSNDEPTDKQLNGANSSKDKGKAPSKEVEKVQAKSNIRKASPAPKALATSSTKTVAKPAKSPTTKTPRTPTEMTAPKLPTKTPDRAQPKEKTATPRAAAAASTKATGPSSIKRPPPLQASPASGTGFVKPKPKSPTRPVELPARLTTHTAASGSKVNGGPRQSLSRASGVMNSTESLGRSPSRASAGTAASGARLTVPKSLKRQSSTINRPRPSLGPPPKQPARDHPPTKKEKEVDEGFLARMTRPTQAFASKTVGKTAASPPRKVAAAPAATKTANKSGPQAAKKTALPHRPKVTAGPSSQQSQASAAAQIAIKVEEVETVEEVVAIAKSVEEVPAQPQPTEAEPEHTEPEHTEEAERPAEEATAEADDGEAQSEPLGSPHSLGGQTDGDDVTSTSEETAIAEPADEPSNDKIHVQVAVQESLIEHETLVEDAIGAKNAIVSDDAKDGSTA